MRSTKTQINVKWTVSILLLGLSVCASAGPSGQPFPGEQDTRFTADLKRDADRAYERGDYARAYRIVSKSLIFRGDKYSQYLMGMMHLNGQGTRQDSVTGVAWLRLAAERNNNKLLAAYKEADSLLTPEQRARSEQRYEELRDEYGDRRVLARLIRKDQRTLRRSTGSRLGATDSLNMVILTMDGRRVLGNQFYGSIRDRIETRFGFLDGVVELGEFELIDDDDDEQEATNEK